MALPQPLPAGGMLALPGALAPLPLPWAAVADAARVRLCLDRPDLPAAEGAAAALRIGLLDDAWILAARARRQADGWERLRPALAAWAAQEAASRGWPAGPVAVAAVDAEAAQRLRGEARAAWSDVAALLGGVELPPWAGPLVLAVGPATAALPALAPDRPAMPVIGVPEPGGWQRADLDRWRGMAAARIARTALAHAHPGTPAWLADGLARAADAATRGAGPSPRDAWERRQAAGPDGLARLLAGGDDPDLGAAVATALIHPRRRAGLGRVLRLIDQGMPAAEALALGAGRDVATLIAEP